MNPIENSYTHNVSASSSNPGVTQATVLDAVGQSSSLQNASGHPHDFFRSPVEEGMQSKFFANTLREMPVSQSLQQGFQLHQRQQLRHEFFQKVQQPNILPSFKEPNIQYSLHSQHQQEIQLQPAQLQYSLQPTFPTQQHQRLIGLQLNSAGLQQNRQLGQQNKVSEWQHQVSLSQQNMLNSLQEPLCPQNNVSAVLQQQKLVGPQFDTLNMQLLQNSSNILQQADVAAAQQKVQQQTLPPVQLHHILGLQKDSDSLQEGMNQGCQMSSARFQFQHVIDQQKQVLQSQLVVPEAMSGSRAQTEHATADNWHDQAYWELQTMKEKYLPELIKVYKNAHAACLQPRELKESERCKNTKAIVEKMIKLLQLSRSDIVRCPKDKLDSYKQLIVRFVCSIQSKNAVSIQCHGQQVQQTGSQSQIPQLQHQGNTKIQLNTANIALASTPAGSICLVSTQQGALNSQPNVLSSLQSSSKIEHEQGNAPSTLQYGPMRSMHQNIVSVPQQTNSYQNSMNSLRPGSSIPLQHLKQPQRHQMMQQMQKLKQQMPLQLIQQKKQQTVMQNMYDVNDSEVRQLMGVSSGMHQQHHTTSQGSEFCHQSLLPTTSYQLHAASPQASQHSSPQLDQKNLLPPVSRVGTPLQSVASPLVFTSHSTPLTPSSVPVDLENHSTGVSLLSIAENVGHPQTPVAPAQLQSVTQIQNQSLAIVTPGISTSPLLTESNSADGTQQLYAMEQPFERLLKAVKLISPEALRASVRDLGTVVNLIDKIAGTAAGYEPGVAVGEDLVASTRYHLQVMNLGPQYRCASANKLKRQISAVALDALSSSASENDNFKQFGRQMPDLDSTATSRIKRRRIEPNNELLEEIRHINQQLVETVIEVFADSTEDAATTEAGEGTIIRCSYRAVALDKNFELEHVSSQMLPILPLWLLVPTNYPNSSPIVLDRLSVGWSDSKESDDLSEKAKSKFSISVRSLSEPMLLGELARTWDACAREVFSEFAQLMGGECFSSRYGTWENCVTAS